MANEHGVRRPIVVTHIHRAPQLRGGLPQDLRGVAAVLGDEVGVNFVVV